MTITPVRADFDEPLAVHRNFITQIAFHQTFRFDDLGNNIEENHFGVDGKLVLNKNNGVAKQTSRYDSHGYLIESAFFSVDGTPILRKDWGWERTAGSVIMGGSNGRRGSISGGLNRRPATMAP